MTTKKENQPIIEESRYKRVSNNERASQTKGKRIDDYGAGTKIAIYVRVSSEEQIEGYSLEAQENACKDFARARNWEITRVYRDPGFSAKDDQRPEFKELIRDARQGKFQAILIHKLDRFMRNMELTSRYFRQLVDMDVLLTTVETQFDFSSPQGKLMFHVMAAFAEWYLANLGEEVKKSKKEMFRKGIHNGMLPFGYKKEEKGHPPVIVPEEAEVIKKAFQMYITNQYSDWDIANFINEQGFKTRRNRNWSKDTARAFLKNEFYFGYVRYKNKITKGSHEAIISRDLYDRCQEARNIRAGKTSNRKRPSKTNPQKYILQQIIRCPSCNRTLRVQGSASKLDQKGKYKYYKEVSPERGLNCEFGGRTIHVDIADEQVIEALYKLNLPEDWQTRIEKRASDLDQITQIERERANIEEKIRRLDDVYVNGRYTREEYDTKRRQLSSDLESLIIPDGATQIEKGLLLDSLSNYLSEATISEKSKIVHLLLDSVYVDFDSKTITHIKPSAEFVPLFRLAANKLGWQEQKHNTFLIT